MGKDKNISLDGREQECELLNRQGGTYNIVTASHIRGSLTPEIVRQALDKIQSRHPSLNWRIEAENCLKFTTQGTQRIPLQVVDKLHEQYWKEILIAQMNTEIDSSKCLMRSVLIPALDEKDISYLIITIHHAISDGLSAVQLHSEILTYCEKISLGQDLTQVTPLDILPPLKTLLPDSPISSQTHESHSEIDVLGFEKWVPIHSRRTGYIYKYLDESLTSKLKKKARQNKTTLHGAYCAAMLLATANIIRTNQKIEVLHTNCISYFDLRPYLKLAISREHLMYAAWEVTSFHTLDTNTSFWDLASNSRQQMRSILKSGVFINEILADEVEDAQDIHSLDNEVVATVDISSIGKLDLPEVFGKYELEEFHTLCGVSAFGGIPMLIVSEFRNKVLLSFLFSEPSLSQETMEILAKNVISNLVDACY